MSASLETLCLETRGAMCSTQRRCGLRPRGEQTGPCVTCFQLRNHKYQRPGTRAFFLCPAPPRTGCRLLARCSIISNQQSGLCARGGRKKNPKKTANVRTYFIWPGHFLNARFRFFLNRVFESVCRKPVGRCVCGVLFLLLPTGVLRKHSSTGIR
jgi:hypothetical protein